MVISIPIHFYYNFGDTLNAGGIDFIYAQTNDAMGAIRTQNVVTGKEEIIGSCNERFAYTDELQADNELKISPKPDSLLRVRIFVEKTDSNPNLPEPTINHFERNGFTAVEWGGTSY